MKIPDGLANLLARHQELDGVVKTAIARFEPWIKHSQVPFFPEYTDHGTDHLEQVLATASSLIRDEAWSVLTPADAAVTVLSVLLHDCAMHLTEDGFVALFQPPWRDRVIGDMGDRPWSVVWEDFMGEVARFDGKKLMSLFGDAAPARRPPLDPNEMSKRDRLLIGEFLRRQHTRLAQEIAEFGVPGPVGIASFAVVDQSPNPVLPLAGIVARSHGAPIRRFLGVLEARFGKGGHRECSAVHSAFLMVLLRIADYLQVQSERAPRQVLSVRRLASPVSQGEWQAHSAILDIRNTMDDPEALHIEARPIDVKSFFRVREWITGIQGELDESWAVLGEVYGRYSELAPLGLILRRIRSNVEDAAFAEKLDFLPRRASFRAADADLLKLLIGPLYGDNPAIGMRELIQNAVDAVRELSVLLKDRGLTEADCSIATQIADVVATVERDEIGRHWVTVSDRGLGMTADVICDYFLTAGASFRRSDDWRKSFETSEGRSKVLRAGRFGIGALAAFLLGSEIHVKTRHIDAPTGIEFSAAVETEFVELRRCDRTVGTTIRIPVSDRVAEQLSTSADRNRRPRPPTFPRDNADGGQSVDIDGVLHDGESVEAEALVDYMTDSFGVQKQEPSNWDWYCLASPSLARFAMGQRLKQTYAIQDDLGSDSRWSRIDHPDYDGTFWTYADAPSFACNGIVVPRCDDRAWRSSWGLRRPNLQVRDPDGKLPLDLQRSELQSGDFPFAEQLGIDIARSFCAFALANMPREVSSLASAIELMRGLESPHLPRVDNFSEWFISADGASYLHPKLLGKTDCKVLLVVRIDRRALQNPKLHVPLLPTLCYTVLDQDRKTASLDRWIREVSGLPNGDWRWSYDRERRASERLYSDLGLFSRTGTRVLLSKSASDRYDRVKSAQKAWHSRKIIEWESNDWVLVRMGVCDAPVFSFKDFAAAGRPANAKDTISECYFGETPEALPRMRVVEQWLDLFGQPLIPFNPDERSAKLGTAYERLKPYMAASRAAREPPS
jgi:molecular chaperone HtpG